MTSQDPIRPAAEARPGSGTAGPSDETVVTSAGYRPEDTEDATGTVAVRRVGGSATRWGIALAIVALVAGVAAAAVFLVAGQSATPSAVLAYAPKDSVIYAEARLDLPGDQRQKLGEFLSKFPGFADQSTMETKIDELLDRLVREATHDEHSWSTEIKPWFGGELSLAVADLPEMPADGATMPDGRGLGLVSVKDAAKARAWVDGVLKDVAHTSQTYNGVDTIVVGDQQQGLVAIVDGKVMLVGDEQSVKAAIDSKGQGGLATADRFAAARAAIEGDAVASYFIDMQAYLDWTTRAPGQSSGGDQAMLSFLEQTYRERSPEWLAGRVRVEADSLRVEQVNPHVDAGPARENRISNVVDNLPASTVAVIDAHDLGATVLDTIELMRGFPGSEDTFRELDQQIALLGGFDALLGWMGDSGIVLTRDGTDVRGGLVVAPTDRAGAERLLNQVKAALAFAGGAGISSREESYNGTTITVVDLGGAEPVPGVAIPELGIAVNDQVVVVGVGLDFVRAVLDAKPGANLADDARYKELIGRVGGENISSIFLDATAVRELVEQLGVAQAPAEVGEYEREVKPYLEPIDAIVGASVIDGDLDRTSFVITVK